MDESLLEAVRELVQVRLRVNTKGLLYVHIEAHSCNVVALDRIANVVSSPRSRVKSNGPSFRWQLMAQSVVVEFCEAVLPYLEEDEALHSELHLAKAVAEVPWYERYEVVKDILDLEGDEDEEPTS